MSKMSRVERLAKRREVSTKQRNQEKEDIFISDYIKHKYSNIHAEALQIYEILSKQYPGKIDIRKTNEHKMWKNQGIPNMHPALNICQEVPPEAQMRVIFPEATTPNPEATAPEATTPNPEATTPNPEATTPNPEATPPEATTPNPEATTPEPKGKIAYKDNMQLIIPLIKSPVNHPGVVTQTLQIITEEIIQEQPQNVDQIEPEILEQLIAELRADPELGSIFEDMEQDAEFEELGMDIDINIDTRLEDELNWQFW